MTEQKFRISPTAKGAIFRLKRWFYAYMYSKVPSEAKDASRGAWGELVGKLIDEINKKDAAEKPARITLNYDEGPRGEFVPLSVKMEIFELVPKESINISFSERAAEVEKEKIKSQYSELLRKAQELGIQLET
jgi:hypothetical protein